MAAHSHYHSLILDLLFLPSKHPTNKITLPSFLPSFLWPHKSGGVIANLCVFGWKVFLLLPNYKLRINVTI